LFLLVLVWRGWQLLQPDEAPPAPLVEQTYDLGRAIDGDTLLLAGGARIRLIGVDAPETVKPNYPVEPWGPEASAFTRQFVSGGRVRLAFDRERLDRYGRYLAYVYVDDRMLNEELVRAGLARFEPHFDYSTTMKTRFRRAEAEARAARRGLWSPPPAPTGGSPAGPEQAFPLSSPVQ
jgi:micrococcal nuclease